MDKNEATKHLLDGLLRTFRIDIMDLFETTADEEEYYQRGIEVGYVEGWIEGWENGYAKALEAVAEKEQRAKEKIRRYGKAK